MITLTNLNDMELRECYLRASATLGLGGDVPLKHVELAAECASEVVKALCGKNRMQLMDEEA